MQNASAKVQKNIYNTTLSYLFFPFLTYILYACTYIICIFAGEMKKIRDFIKLIIPIFHRITGLQVVYAGVILMVFFYLIGLTNHNLFLFLPLLMTIAGIIIHIVRAKHQEDY